MRMARLVMHRHLPGGAGANDLLDRLDAAIKDIDLPPVDPEPAPPTIHGPHSPVSVTVALAGSSTSAARMSRSRLAFGSAPLR